MTNMNVKNTVIQSSSVQLGTSPEHFIPEQLWCWNNEGLLHRSAWWLHGGL